MVHKTSFFSCILYPVVALLSLLGFSQTAEAAAYVKFDGVDGESKDKGHGGWSDILSFGASAERPEAGASGQSRRRGSVIVEDMRLQIGIDSSTEAITEAALRGEVFDTVQIDLCEGQPESACDSSSGGNQHCYLRYELKDVLVTSYEVQATDSPERGVMAFTLSFEDFMQEYEPNPEGCRPER